MQTPTRIPKPMRSRLEEGPQVVVKRPRIYKENVNVSNSQPYNTPEITPNMHTYSEYDPGTEMTTYSQVYPTPPTMDFYSRNVQANRYLAPESKIASHNLNISVLTLPDKIRSIFQFSHFNKMQSECFHQIFHSNKNCVVGSPTGSGKTVLFELAILRLYMNNQMRTSGSKEYKILYMAPTKALCTERFQDWSKKFIPLNLSVGLLTSDTSVMETENVRKSDIIICTAEKWDLLTRRWSDYSRLFELVSLLLVDEIHVIKDKRGSTLEVVITRMKTACNALRIIALSATVPNFEDLSTWIRENHSSPFPALSLVFGEEYRAVKLNRFVYGCKNTSNNDYKFDSFLNPKVLEIIRTHFKGKPVLIFCPTRAVSVSTAKYLNDNCYGLFPNLNKHSTVPIKDKDLNNMVNNGIAFHHAGLSYEDRQAAEKNFLTGAVKVLCSTSTLAVGVNLPAYLVIVKGTKSWSDGELKEYSELDILQMIGRAGRPQFEKEGCAVILTEHNSKAKYERIVQGTEKLESCLHLNFAENLAAEITLKTITSVESAVDWLKSTFFFTRYIKNSNAYNDVKELKVGCYDLQQRLTMFCNEKLNELVKEGIIIEENGNYQSTPYCDSMSRHYVAFETIKSFIHSAKHQNLKEVISLFSRSYEFKDLRLKHQEIKLFKEISTSPLVKYRLDPKTAMSHGDKINLILQYELGGLEYPSYNGSLKLHSSFINDKNYVFKQSPRIARCMIDVFIEKKDAGTLLNSLKLARCINGKCWEDSAMVLRQLQGIGLAYVRKFASHDVLSLAQAKNLQSNQIEYFLGMKPGNGIKIKKDLDNIPKLSIASVLTKESISGDFSKVEVVYKLSISTSSNVSSWHGKLLIADVVTEINNKILVDFRRIPVSKIQGSKDFILKIPLTSSSDLVKCHVFCSEIAGIKESHILDHSAVPEWKFKKLIRLENETSTTDNVDEFDEFDEFDDDDELDILLNKKPQDKATEIKPYQLRENGKYECNHPCKDKSTCRHLCCKEGLLKNPNQSSHGCNHACKDKSKCRHICCRETLASQKGIDVQQIVEAEKPTDKDLLFDDEVNDVGACENSIEILHNKSGINMKIPDLNKKRDVVPAILSSGRSGIEMGNKKMKKLSASTKKNNILDSDIESENDDYLEINDALNLLLNKPKSDYLIKNNFKVADNFKVDETSEHAAPKITTVAEAGSTLTTPILIDEKTDQNISNESHYEKIAEARKEELKKDVTWFDDYSVKMSPVKAVTVADDKVQTPNAEDDDDDSLLDFLGSDIELG